MTRRDPTTAHDGAMPPRMIAISTSFQTTYFARIAGGRTLYDNQPMRVRGLILLVVVSLLGGSLLGSGYAYAEKVKTNQETKVRAKPGEHERVLVTVKSGQTMTILTKDG